MSSFASRILVIALVSTLVSPHLRASDETPSPQTALNTAETSSPSDGTSPATEPANTAKVIKPAVKGTVLERDIDHTFFNDPVISVRGHLSNTDIQEVISNYFLPTFTGPSGLFDAAVAEEEKVGTHPLSTNPSVTTYIRVLREIKIGGKGPAVMDIVQELIEISPEHAVIEYTLDGVLKGHFLLEFAQASNGVTMEMSWNKRDDNRDDIKVILPLMPLPLFFPGGSAFGEYMAEKHADGEESLVVNLAARINANRK